MSYQQEDGGEDNLDTNYDFLIKVLLLGDSGVGKTCFLHQYTEGEFKQKFIATVGVDFRLKKLVGQKLHNDDLGQGWRTFLVEWVNHDIKIRKENKFYEFPEDDEEDSKKKIHLQLWDTAGQERYRSLTKAFFRDGMGFLLLFDLSRETSFQSVRQWLNEIKEQAYCDNPDIILIGNKNDLANWEVKSEQAKELAKSVGIPYIESSAATGENVEKAVNMLLDLVMKRMREYVSSMDSDSPNGDSAQAEQVARAMPSSGNVSIPEPAEEEKKSSCPC